MTSKRASRRAVVALHPPSGLRASALAVGGEELVVLSFPVEASRRAGLSEAERLVLDHLAAGLSNADIARARSTSPRTIANQVAAIFRKLGVRSRRELFASGAGATPSPGSPS